MSSKISTLRSASIIGTRSTTTILGRAVRPAPSCSWTRSRQISAGRCRRPTARSYGSTTGGPTSSGRRRCSRSRIVERPGTAVASTVYASTWLRSALPTSSRPVFPILLHPDVSAVVYFDKAKPTADEARDRLHLASRRRRRPLSELQCVPRGDARVDQGVNRGGRTAEEEEALQVALARRAPGAGVTRRRSARASRARSRRARRRRTRGSRRACRPSGSSPSRRRSAAAPGASLHATTGSRLDLDRARRVLDRTPPGDRKTTPPVVSSRSTAKPPSCTSR